MSTKKEFDLLIFISRVGPPHLGHYGIVKEALTKARDVLILVGSSNVARSIRNPFTAEERMELLGTFCPDSVIIRAIDDYPYNMPQWLAHVQEKVSEVVTSFLGRDPAKQKIGLIGYNKDNSSYYLKRFPQWSGVNAPAFTVEEPMIPIDVDRLGVNLKQGQLLSATDLRRVIFDPFGLHGWNDIKPYVPRSMLDTLAKFLDKDYLDDFRHIPVIEIGREELRYEMDYKAKWAPAPWKPTFLTVDAVVIQSGHVLLVKRGISPGRGLYALPGGFLEQEETLAEAVLRELDEETKIKVSPETLKRTIVATEIFDDPWRSIRGRTVTQASVFDLRAEATLPKVKGSDDADKAIWQPFAQINPRHVFEDHYHITHRMYGLLKGN